MSGRAADPSPPAEAERIAAGLCADCGHARRVTSAKQSTFWLCRRAATDTRYRKYPPLPVVACPGFETTSAGGG